MYTEGVSSIKQVLSTSAKPVKMWEEGRGEKEERVRVVVVVVVVGCGGGGGGGGGADPSVNVASLSIMHHSMHLIMEVMSLWT